MKDEERFTQICGDLSKIPKKVDKDDGRNRKKTLQSEIAKIYQNQKERATFLSWITEKAKNKNTNPRNIKKIQISIAAITTQRLMFDLAERDKLTKKVRLMRANLPLMRKGLCSHSEVKAKEYLFIVEELEDDNINLNIGNDHLDILSRVLELKEKQIIYLYFGLHCKSMPTNQISKFMGIPLTETIKIKKSALKKLKNNPDVEEFFKGHL
jgi:DNA-directed RNA polymerase specialized sigma subunit